MKLLLFSTMAFILKSVMRPFLFLFIWPLLAFRDSCCHLTWDSLRPIADPIVVYSANFVSYSSFVFLLLIDALNLDRVESTLDGLLWLMFLFVVGLLLREVRSVLSLDMRFYFSGLDHKLDIAMLFLFLAFFALRATAFFTTDVPNSRLLRASCYLLGSATIIACLRFLRYFSVHPIIGPVQKAFSKIVEEVLLFLVILAVFLVAFATGITNVYRGTLYAFNDTVRANTPDCPTGSFNGYVVTE